MELWFQSESSQRSYGSDSWCCRSVEIVRTRREGNVLTETMVPSAHWRKRSGAGENGNGSDSWCCRSVEIVRTWREGNILTETMVPSVHWRMRSGAEENGNVLSAVSRTLANGKWSSAS